MEMLISSCPICKKPLGWTATLGVWRCEHCGGSLRHHRPGKVSWKFRTEAAAVGQIISPIGAERVEALRALPMPFCNWEPGDVFDAIVELGTIATRPDDQNLARDMRTGNYSAGGVQGVLDIVNGYRIVKGWPNSLATLARQVVIQNTSADEKVRNDSLGPLQKFFGRSYRDSSLRQLMTSALPEAFAEMSLPTRMFSHSRLFRGTPAGARRLRPAGAGRILPVGPMSQAAASKLLHIQKKVLRRLDSDGLCLLRPANSRRAVPYYNAEMLTRSVGVYKKAIDPRQAARRLGIPEFVLPAVCHACSVSQIIDADAVLLSGHPTLYEPNSFDAFVSKMLRIAVKPGEYGVSIEVALGARGLEPNAWAALISGILHGKICVRIATRAKDAPMRRVRIDPDEVTKLLKDVPVYIPAGVTVSGMVASKLLNRGYFVICTLIQLGIIKTNSASSKQWAKIPLEELLVFRENYLTSKEAARLLLRIWPDDAALRAVHPGAVGRAVASRLADLEVAPIRTPYNNRVIWPRRDIEAALERLADST